MRLTLVFLLIATIAGVYCVTTPFFNPDGPFMSMNAIRQAEFDGSARTIAQIFKDETFPDAE